MQRSRSGHLLPDDQVQRPEQVHQAKPRALSHPTTEENGVHPSSVHCSSLLIGVMGGGGLCVYWFRSQQSLGEKQDIHTLPSHTHTQEQLSVILEEPGVPGKLLEKRLLGVTAWCFPVRVSSGYYCTTTVSLRLFFFTISSEQPQISCCCLGETSGAANLNEFHHGARPRVKREFLSEL